LGRGVCCKGSHRCGEGIFTLQPTTHLAIDRHPQGFQPLLAVLWEKKLQFQKTLCCKDIFSDFFLARKTKGMEKMRKCQSCE
jgi:hypothetical protein